MEDFQRGLYWSGIESGRGQGTIPGPVSRIFAGIAAWGYGDDRNFTETRPGFGAATGRHRRHHPNRLDALNLSVIG